MASAFLPKQSLFPLFQVDVPNRHSLRTVVHAGIGDGQAKLGVAGVPISDRPLAEFSH
jgi:hypothetical protein